MSLSRIHCSIFAVLFVSPVLAQNWPQGAGPNGNWKVEGDHPPTSWSATTGENIAWRTPLPESGQGSVIAWGDRLFVTSNVPWEEGTKIDENQKKKGPMGTDIIGYCLDADTGKILWQVTLKGTRLKLYAGPFSDSTAPSPITDGKYVWFYNVSGMIGCFDFDGHEIWTHSWIPRGIMANRQFEPILVGDVILNIEVLDKSTVIDERSLVDNDMVAKLKSEHGNRDYFTYIHAYDKLTGELKWISEASTSTHSASCLGKTQAGELALLHGRGGGHHPIETPKGLSLTSLAAGSEGKTLWNYELETGSEYTHQWNSAYATWWTAGHHIVLDATTGQELRRQPLGTPTSIRAYDAEKGEYVDGGNTIKLNKKVTTHYSNLLVGNHHYFRTYSPFMIGRVHLETGKTEYLQVPVEVDRRSTAEAEFHWSKVATKNDTRNSRGIDVGAADKRSKGNGWGHISAAPPILVGNILYIPTMIGTVYVVDTASDRLHEDALLSVSDLGPPGETWSLSSLSYADGRLYHRTMKEVLCIGSR
jgi:outer membrane protein assembly factor BamB